MIYGIIALIITTINLVITILETNRIIDLREKFNAERRKNIKLMTKLAVLEEHTFKVPEDYTEEELNHFAGDR